MSNSEESDVASELDNKIDENNDDTSEAESGDDGEESATKVSDDLEQDDNDRLEASATKASDDLDKDGSDDKVVTWQDLVCIAGKLLRPQHFS